MTDEKIESSGKDAWDKFQVVSLSIASLLVPLVIALIANTYNQAISSDSNKVKYTELAISILRDKATPENKSIRDWAIDIANQYSGVSMSEDARVTLLTNSLTDWTEFQDYNLTEVPSGERLVRFQARQVTESGGYVEEGDDPFELSGRGWIAYADEDWHEGSVPAGSESEKIFLIGRGLVGHHVEVIVREYDLDGNEVNEDYRDVEIENGNAIYVYQTKKLQKE